MELDVEHQARMLAPLRLVREELDSLGGSSRQVPPDNLLRSDPGRRAIAKATPAWGPVKRVIAMEFSLHDVRPRERLRYVLEVRASSFYAASVALH